VSRDNIEYLVAQDLSKIPLTNNNIATGFRVAELSRDHESGAVSYFSSLSPHWIRRESGYYTCDTEILIMKGDFVIGKTTLQAGDYCYIPAGCVQEKSFSENGCDLFMMFEGEPIFVESLEDLPNARSQLRINKLEAKKIPWEKPPSHEGRPKEEAPPGLGVKYLRIDPDTKGYTLLTKQPAGWFDAKLESHSIWEELILLDGDYLMGRMGKVNAGTYIFRGSGIEHGPQVSRYGCVWFARGPAEIDFDYQETPWAHELIEKYLNSDHLFKNGHETGPWGNWL